MTELYKYLRFHTFDALIEDYKGKPIWIVTRYVPERKRKLAYVLDQNVFTHFGINLDLNKMLAPENEWLDPTEEEIEAFAKFYKLLQTKPFGEYISNYSLELPGIVLTFDGPSKYSSCRDKGGEYYIEGEDVYIIV